MYVSTFSLLKSKNQPFKCQHDPVVCTNIVLPFVVQAMGSLSNEMLQLVVVAMTVSVSFLPLPRPSSYIGPH